MVKITKIFIDFGGRLELPMLFSNSKKHELFELTPNIIHD